jgi:flagellar hook-associated protein 2
MTLGEKMGAVGLNFGSATSGQGFDVASTVNQIVTNLRAVETPWKTLIANLQGRDAVLSSLGAQLSALAADLQSLTDFQGVLAGKTGSSSDTNVLQLTSAGPTAVAGTHAVTVQNMAQTSSAATDLVGAGDAVSGGITLRVGSGPWQTVNVGEAGTAKTLSGFSAAINAASIGVRASVLTDADGSQRLSLVSQTAGASGEITIANASNHPASPTTLADSTALDANVGLGLATIQDGIDARFTVDGVQLTSASSTVSNAIQGITFQLLSAGTSNSEQEIVQVVVDNDTAGVVSAINTFVSDYNATIKAINAQEGKDASGNSEPLYGTSVLAALQRGMLSAMSTSSGGSPISSLISLGINASPAADGTIMLDRNALNDALNNHFDSVVSFFQEPGRFGSTFVGTLNGLGGSFGSGGAIALALKESSAEERTLNQDIDEQESLITVEKARLTTELNLANQILQSIPAQINQVNEIYSAITGYKQNS